MSDEQLVTSFLEGNTDSFGVLVKKYTSILYGFVRRFGFSEDETADILQDIFIKAWKTIHSFDERKSSYKSFTFLIARSVIYDALRKRKSFFERFAQEKDNEIDDVVDESQDAIVSFEYNQDKKILDSLILNLSDEEKMIIVLHHQEDMTFKEIAQVVEMSIDTVKSKYRRSLIKLKKIYEQVHQK